MTVNILGQVNMPGNFLVPKNADILDIIAYASGLKNGANTNSIIVLSKDNNKKKINLRAYIENGNVSEIKFRPNDTIFIEQTMFSKLLENANIANSLLTLMNIYLIYNNLQNDN